MIVDGFINYQNNTCQSVFRIIAVIAVDMMRTFVDVSYYFNSELCS
jgi:hypothetical protein